MKISLIRFVFLIVRYLDRVLTENWYFTQFSMVLITEQLLFVQIFSSHDIF